MKIGILRETRVPPETRVAFTPRQCRMIMDQHKGVEIVVQPYQYRCFPDSLYTSHGVELQEDLDDCDLLIGIKEPNPQDLMANKAYLIFSHTIKKQPRNFFLLSTALRKNVRLIDYECLVDSNDRRIIGFGKYAGLVGTYAAMRLYGLRKELYNIKTVQECDSQNELLEELDKVKLPPVKIVATGSGRVWSGAKMILDALKVKAIEQKDFIQYKGDESVYTLLNRGDHYYRKDDKPYTNEDFYYFAYKYASRMADYVAAANMYIACHYWDMLSPKLLTREDLERCNDLDVIADISCDIPGPIASTLRHTNVKDPFYGYDPHKHQETAPYDEGAISVMSVENLPCALPKDASRYFGERLIKDVLPHLLHFTTNAQILIATITIEGQLTEKYRYLEDYAEGRL